MERVRRDCQCNKIDTCDKCKKYWVDWSKQENTASRAAAKPPVRMQHKVRDGELAMLFSKMSLNPSNHSDE
jgi:hypothetical protein